MYYKIYNNKILAKRKNFKNFCYYFQSYKYNVFIIMNITIYVFDKYKKLKLKIDVIEF